MSVGLLLLTLWLVLQPVKAAQDNNQNQFDEQAFHGLIDENGQAQVGNGGIGEGKWTLVMIWATHCHICKEQKPLISAFHEAHKDLDAHVYGVALDGPSALPSVRQYMKSHRVLFPTYVGDIGSIAASYQALTDEPFRGTPTYLLFNPDGELMGNNPGPISIAALEQFMARNGQ